MKTKLIAKKSYIIFRFLAYEELLLTEIKVFENCLIFGESDTCRVTVRVRTHALDLVISSVEWSLPADISLYFPI